MERKEIRGTAMLLSASIIWGSSFVAQTVGLTHVGPFTFIAVRSLIAALTLVPVFLAFDRMGYNRFSPESRKPLWKGGLICGGLLFLSTNFQQSGMVYTTAGKAGFITSLYIVLVPVLGLFLGKRARRTVWLAVALALVGLYLISVRENFSVGRGDLLVLCGALFFAIHIIVVSKYALLADGIRLSCVQFLVCGLVTLPFMLLEKPSLQSILDAATPILYSAVLSGGVAYTLQILGQRDLEPSRASLMMCPESVFAALGGWVVLGETLSLREFLGCACVLTAVVLTVLPGKRAEEKTNPGA